MLCFVAIETDCVACTHSINASGILPIKISQAANFNKLRAECWCSDPLIQLNQNFRLNFCQITKSHHQVTGRWESGRAANASTEYIYYEIWQCGCAVAPHFRWCLFFLFTLFIFFAVARRQVVVFLWQKHFRPKYEQKDEPKRRQWNVHHVLKFSPYMQLQC